ncbi:MAG: hypothetical protein HOV73_01890 [Streptomyces sp.]|nr:hypothetical protein [Streptomyces sp.]
MHETVQDVRETSRRIGEAAETQATLNIALTSVAVTGLLVAVVALIVARGARS